MPVELVVDGKPMADQWLASARTAVGNEVKVVFGGRVMVHAKVRSTSGLADRRGLSRSQRPARDAVTFGIMEWVGDQVHFLMAGPRKPRPAGFDAGGRGCTLSRWRRRPL